MGAHQQAQVVQFWLGKTGGVGVVQNVSAMAVVAAVGNAAANFVQAGRPVELARGALAVLGGYLGKQLARHLGHALGLWHIDSKALHECGNGCRA